jgi:hypothetical protein
MSVLEKAKTELLDRLAKNPIEDDDDLMDYVQYACRLASLGDLSKIEEFPALFAREQFAGRIEEILKLRCREGWSDIYNYPGIELALSLIDAQDFYLFDLRFGQDYPKLKPYFTKWWQDCDNAEIDEECKEFLEKFVKVFPIPEEERLPVIDTPISDREWMLLEFATQHIPIPQEVKDARKQRTQEILESLHHAAAAH